MMIKKKISFLAASVVVASGAQAAITGGGGTDSSVILALVDFGATAGNGSYLIDLTATDGVTQDGLLAGNGAIHTLSGGAQSFIAGASDLRWALFAVSGQEGPFVTYTQPDPSVYAFNYFYDYSDPSLGVVYAANAPTATAINGATLLNAIADINVWINDANTNAGDNILDGEAAIANGAPADGDTPARNALLNGFIFNNAGDVAQIHFMQTDPAGRAGDAVLSGPYAITTPGGPQQGAYLVGDSTFNITGVTTVIPVPAAAWLFGSALLGLGVVRRK